MLIQSADTTPKRGYEAASPSKLTRQKLAYGSSATELVEKAIGGFAVLGLPLLRGGWPHQVSDALPEAEQLRT